MKSLSKKMITGTIAASLLIGGAAFVQNQAFADTTSTSSTQTKADARAQKDHAPRKDAGYRGINIFKEAATILNTDEKSIMEALKSGKTLVQFAQDKGVTEDALLQKLSDAESAAITQAVTDGKLTQEQADKQTANLADRLKKMVENSGMNRGGGDGKGFPGAGGPQRGPGGHGFAGGGTLKEAATILGSDEKTIMEAIKSGKTLAQIAQDKGITEDDFLQKLVAAETASLDKAVTDGKLKQEQADKMKTGLSDRLKKEIENKQMFGFSGQMRKPGGFGPMGNVKQLAQTIGITEDELTAGMKAGKSLVEIAEEKGISRDQLISKLKDSLTEQLNKMVDRKAQPRADKKADHTSSEQPAATTN
ncbi:hypothetical protein [Paenibacillus thalictri]|uniref:LysM domain-containing protein n=1 Tax=Paenibacillus thalictri TaxID=2527873 RepID=A0A4V2J4V6_9BACL|nr:hypothetical protein [Paenibacillus thalictri]TBL81362.1 hypothetical protein EYB31_04580 [Paenibacillus thalictri]